MLLIQLKSYSPSGEGHGVSYADYEMIRGGATQIHHLNLLKAQREAESISLVSRVKKTLARA